MDITKHSPTPWEYRNVPSAGLEIFAPIPETNCIECTLKAQPFPIYHLARRPVMMIGYEQFIQFPPAAWKELQEANAAFIVRAVNEHDQLIMALKGVSIMLNTELKSYAEEPWAKEVRACLTEPES